MTPMTLASHSSQVHPPIPALPAPKRTLKHQVQFVCPFVHWSLIKLPVTSPIQ